MFNKKIDSLKYIKKLSVIKIILLLAIYGSIKHSLLIFRCIETMLLICLKNSFYNKLSETNYVIMK